MSRFTSDPETSAEPPMLGRSSPGQTDIGAEADGIVLWNSPKASEERALQNRTPAPSRLSSAREVAQSHATQPPMDG
ncbi:hypothetical protein BX600DRAFT_458326 [Xylariales sp. PMI_506]|nr:hypothetical protein BX600DRAFT_458326 [Xylariales sp. PMI_506]